MIPAATERRARRSGKPPSSRSQSAGDVPKQGDRGPFGRPGPNATCHHDDTGAELSTRFERDETGATRGLAAPGPSRRRAAARLHELHRPRVRHGSRVDRGGRIRQPAMDRLFTQDQGSAALSAGARAELDPLETLRPESLVLARFMHRNATKTPNRMCRAEQEQPGSR